MRQSRAESRWLDEGREEQDREDVREPDRARDLPVHLLERHAERGRKQKRIRDAAVRGGARAR